MREIQYDRLELLAPAGSLDAAKAAVNAGADAIYMGGPLFSARAYAASSKDGGAKEETDQLLCAIAYCHLRGVKVFMTLNILMKEQEMEGLAAYLSPYIAAGLDAVIVQDAGVFLYVRRHFPELPIHVSTQMTVTGPYFASLLKQQGASRIVAARELSLEELGRIYDATGMELEAFIHGALCYSYSGQCLMSSVLGGRSGNRGRCAGPCRLPYTVYDEHGEKVGRGAQYYLSMKDLDTLSRLAGLIRAGVMSFKIEGRMKSPLYVAAVVSVYRKYLDRTIEELKNGTGKAPAISEKDRRLLREVFDRGGSTDGYLSSHNGRDMIALSEKPQVRVPDEKLLSEIRETYLEKEKKVPVRMEAKVQIGKAPVLQMTATVRGHMFTAAAAGSLPAEAARGKALGAEELEKRLSKLGNTAFQAEKVSLELGEHVFLPVGQINELRRMAADELEKAILAGFGRNERAVSGSASCSAS